MESLAKIEEVTAAQVYTEKKMGGLLDKLEEEALLFIPITDTAQGRKDIASLAHKISRSKTCLDTLGKNLTEEAQKKVKVVNVERKAMRERLDVLRDKVRAPLNKWEDEEKLRLENIEIAIKNIPKLSKPEDEQGNPLTVTTMKQNLLVLKAIKINDDFGERINDAAKIKDFEVQNLEAIILRREKIEAEQEELERLRKEKSEKEEEERMERIRKEGEERLRLEVEENAKIEKERVKEERLKLEQKHKDEIERIEKEKLKETDKLIRQAEEAEQKRLDDVQAEKDKAESLRLELIKEQEHYDRLERETKEEEERVEKKRQENKTHQTKINRNILSALTTLGIDEKTGKKVITEIVQGHIPNVTINY